MIRTRRSVRAFLLSSSETLLVIRRERPDRDPYLVLPGGGIEPGESERDCLARELREELGASAMIGPRVLDVHGRDIVYVARLLTLDVARREGPEFHDPARGAYIAEVHRIIELARESSLLVPTEARSWLHQHAADR